MTQIISEVWAGLRDAGLPEVMLYLPDNSASRCHWDDTAVVNEVRVALLADQDRQIVRIVPVDSCVGIGVASPKGVDPSGYKMVVQKKLRRNDGEPDAPGPEPARTEPPPSPAAPAPEAPPVARVETPTNRWGIGLSPAAAGRSGGPAPGPRS